MGLTHGAKLIALGLFLACTPGEGPREGAPAPVVTEPSPADPGAVPDTAGVAPANEIAEREATELLIEAQLAYEAAQPDEALRLADRVLAGYPATSAAPAARWVAARAAFGLGRYERAAELAARFADEAPGATQEAEARDLVELARDALEAPAPDAPARIGAVLPRSGSRILVRYADWILDGVRIAVEEFERRHGRRVELVIADDQGGARTRDAIAELERRGAVAVIGPLLPEQLATAAGARTNRDLVMVSPTVPSSPLPWPDLYSVAGGDTRGAQELGRYAAEVGFTQAAVLYPRTPDYERKAEAFRVEFEGLGGEVRTLVPYDSGTTTFGAPMQRILAAVAPPAPDTLAAMLPTDSVGFGFPADTGLVADTLRIDPDDPWQGRPQLPFALFVPAPDRDVQQIAPQVAFYGLDSAGVQVFGDEGWTSARVRRVVPSQDIDGVIAASHFPPDRASALADPEFVRLYEERYRRSLENRLPALGYDAGNLVLQALPNRMLTPRALGQRFEFLTGIRGATGVLSVRARQVVRSPFLVEVRGGALRSAPFPWEYTLPVPKPPLPADSLGEGRSGR